MHRGDKRDSLNVPLEDTALLHELELLARLMVAANHCTGRLGEGEVDALLAKPTRAECLSEDS